MRAAPLTHPLTLHPPAAADRHAARRSRAGGGGRHPHPHVRAAAPTPCTCALPARGAPAQCSAGRSSSAASWVASAASSAHHAHGEHCRPTCQLQPTREDPRPRCVRACVC